MLRSSFRLVFFFLPGTFVRLSPLRSLLLKRETREGLRSHFPENFGWRFSRKALTASRWSLVRPAMSWLYASYSRASGSSRLVTLLMIRLDSSSALFGPVASLFPSSSVCLYGWAAWRRLV